MSILRFRFLPTTAQQRHSGIIRGIAILLALLVTAGILLIKDELGSLGHYGYPAIFFTSLVSSATPFFPAPSMALILAMSRTVDPISLGLTAGMGSALGELSGYFVGYAGQATIGQRPFVHYLEQLMRKASDLLIFSLALVPNPLVDLGGIIAGASQVPVWRFVLLTWLGRSLRFALLAYIGILIG